MRSRLTVLRDSWRWPQYVWVLGLSVAWLFLIVELRNLSAVVWFYDMTHSVTETGLFVLSLFGGLTTLFSPLGTIIVVVFALGCSVNLVLLYQYLRRQHRLRQRSSGRHATTLNTVGTAVALLGIGCASCGTAILFSLLSALGAGGLILSLPLHGEEFGLIGIGALVYTSWYLLGALSRPNVCP